MYRSEGHGDVWYSKILPGMKQAILCVLLCTQDQVEHRKVCFSFTDNNTNVFTLCLNKISHF